MPTIFWFRNDLRLIDNQALTEAIEATDDLIPIYILDTKSECEIGSAQKWWLHHSLNSLQKSLNKKGAKLHLQKGDPSKVILELIKKYKVKSIYWNKVFEPAALQLDSLLEDSLDKIDVEVNKFNGNLLTDPALIKNKSGGYFKVFTPYWRHIMSILQPREIVPEPKKISQKSTIKSEKLDSWDLLPKSPDWSEGFSIWKPGEKGAREQLKKFLDDGLQGYKDNRDIPSLELTSRLSPHVHFGELSPIQIWNTVEQVGLRYAKLQKGSEAYLRQLIWREFSFYLLYYFPELNKKNFNSKFNGFKWKKNKKALKAWQKGLTGYPIVDAGMRELWHTGYMHNRVRMITASFLTKDLLIDWREGESWFWDTLLDADIANNSFGWQWVAGSGADAAPYFRIFNPIIQGEKFDKDGLYVRKWCPELAKLPNKYIHHPWDAPEDILDSADIKLGKNYPLPIVDHKVARDLALEKYGDLK